MAEEKKEERGPVVHITGFGKFHGCPVNPTERLVQVIKENPPKGCNLGNLEVVEVSVEAIEKILPAFYNKLDPDREHVFIHLGVHGAATGYHIETKAWNNANFSCPDMRGKWVRQQPINAAKKHESFLEATVDCKRLMQMLSDKRCKLSTDPGRYLCNYIYYRSLTLASQSKAKCRAVFIHVPHFRLISEKEQFELCCSIISIVAGGGC